MCPERQFFAGVRRSTLCLLSQIIGCVLPIDRVFAQQSDQDITVLPEATVKASERDNQLEAAFDTWTLRHALLFGVDDLSGDLDSQTMRGLSRDTPPS